jgi:hypothetical protein
LLISYAPGVHAGKARTTFDVPPVLNDMETSTTRYGAFARVYVTSYRTSRIGADTLSLRATCAARTEGTSANQRQFIGRMCGT